MKKLFQINTVVNFGSTGRIAEELGQIAIANNWESYIAYARKGRPSQSKLIRIGNHWDVLQHGLQTRLFDRHGLASKMATLELIEKIKQIEPDIIHLHNLHGYYLNIEILFRFFRKKEIPIVWTFHDCWPMTGHCTHFDYVGCEKWKIECHNCPQKKQYPASLGCDRSNRNFHLKKELFTSLNRLMIVAVSEWLGNKVKQSFLAHYPVKIINNGVNTEIFTSINNSSIRHKYNLNRQITILGVASNWGHRKGLNDFIELRKKLNNEYEILLVGLTKSQIKNLPEGITGLARTESLQELAELYSIAEVFVNPTWEDNFPTINLEALSCGTPIITYKTGGSIESVSEETGFVVDKGDISGILKTIQTIHERGKDQYSSACRTRAKELYDKNDRYQDYVNLYELLLSNRL